MRILFIVTESESANGICTLVVMKEMIKQGYEVYCITNHEFRGRHQYNIDGIYYYTVTPRLVYRISSFLIHAQISNIMRVFITKTNWLINKLKLMISIFTWPWVSPLYTDRIYILAKRLCKKNNIDIIVPIYTQIDTLIAAYFIKKKQPLIYYIPYFLDSLSGGYGPRYFSSRMIIKRGLFWEQILLANANMIIAMESSRCHHEKYSSGKKYYKNFTFLDLPLLTIMPEKPKRNTPDNNVTKILYAGSLPNGVRSPEFFLKVFACLNESSYQLIFIGTKECAILNEYARQDQRVKIIGRCPHHEVIEYEKDADIFLNIGNTISSMTPSKIFEYMSLGKPIISTTPIKEDPSLAYLRKYPLSLILEESSNIKESAHNVHKFIEDNKGSDVPYEQLHTEFYVNTAEAFFHTLSNFER